MRDAPTSIESTSRHDLLLNDQLLNRIASGDRSLIQEAIAKQNVPAEEVKVNHLVVDLMTMVAERRDAVEFQPPAPAEVAEAPARHEHRGSRR